jgi:glycosyltransferase involved in cell wall biosynthesis
MRIILLSYRGNMYCGGQGIYVYYLSKYLARQGHEVHLVQGPPYTWETPWCTVHKLKNYNMFATRKFFTKFIPPKESLLNLYSPLHFYEFTMTRFGFFPEMSAFSFRAYLCLSRLWQECPFDIIHDNQTLGWGLLLMKTFGIPVVATIHHPLKEDQKEDFQQLPDLSDRLRRTVYYPLLMHQVVTPRLDELITVSRTAADSVARAYSVPEDRVRVVYNGVDTELFRPDPEARKTPRRLIFVGNTEDRKKGIRYLLEAMLYLPRDVTLTVVDGGAPRHAVMEQLCRRYNIGDRITCTGKIPTEEVVRKYQESEIAVSSSIYEGFGFPAAEAMACGLPVVATDGGALPEVVGPSGDAGFIVPKRNARALAHAIQRLLDDKSLRRQMGVGGRKRIESRFSWAVASREMTSLYEENIKRKKSLSPKPGNRRFLLFN